MSAGAQLSVTEMRGTARCPVDHLALADHQTLGEMALHVCNVSPAGFMVDGCVELSRGARVIVRLPVIGRIEGTCMWTCDERAGFQFERILRTDDFTAMIGDMQPRTRLRRSA